MTPPNFGRRFRQGTFLWQMTVVVAAGVLGVAMAAALVSSWQGGRQIRNTLLDQGLNLATGLAQQSQLALLTGGAENATDAMERVLSFPDVLQVEVLGIDGRALAKRGKAPAAMVHPALAPQRGDAYLEAETDQAWSFVAPVRTRAAEASPFDSAAAGGGSQLLGYVRITQGKAALLRLAGKLVAINVGVGLALAALLLWVLRLMAKRLTRPLGELATVMSAAGAGQVGLRARLSGPSDIASMAQVFNEMMEQLEQREQELQQKNAELLQHAALLEQRVEARTLSLTTAKLSAQEALEELKAAQARLVESEKLASLGRLVAGVAHELNTPLGNALTAASALVDRQRSTARALREQTLRKSELQAALDTNIDGNELVLNNVRRAADIIRNFKQLAIDQTTEMRRGFALDVVLQEVLSSVRPMVRHTPYRIATDLAPDLAMDSFPGPLGQVITNIVQNAVVHGFEGREQGVLTVHCMAHGEQRVRIVCSDDGVGMDEEVRARMFDAFFTTKLGRGGSGLGMQIVHNIVTALLGGAIEVDSGVGAGTRIILTLPRKAPAERRHDKAGANA
jgi:two-component system NtrC family sensor kinase